MFGSDLAVGQHIPTRSTTRSPTPKTPTVPPTFACWHFDGDEDGYVNHQTASDRIARYVERVRRLFERDHGNELRVQCTDGSKARFLSPVDEDDEINENTAGFEHAELMRAAYNVTR